MTIAGPIALRSNGMNLVKTFMVQYKRDVEKTVWQKTLLHIPAQPDVVTMMSATPDSATSLIKDSITALRAGCDAAGTHVDGYFYSLAPFS